MASKSTGHVVEFHYDISCPFAYIASTKIEALALRTGAKILYRPVLLGAIYRATAAPQGAAGSASDVFNPTKKTVTSRAFQRTLNRHALPYTEPPRHPMKTTGALRLLYFVAESERPRLSTALFRAYWVEGKNISEKQTLIQAVQHSHISNLETVLKAIEDGSFEGPVQRGKLETATNDAVQRGSPGVPGFWIPEEIWTEKKSGTRRKGRLYWGQDRMHFVEAVLLALNEGRTGDEIGKISPSLLSLIPRSTTTHSAAARIPHGEEVKVEFWYDFSSPWAFLGWTQLARLQRQFGHNLQIEMRPFLLGILFREIGAPNTPSSAISLQKKNYMNLDHGDWVRFWNAVNVQQGGPEKEIEFYWADNFPIRTPSVLRVAIVKPELVAVLYRACWERNLDMSSDEILTKVISEAGYDGPQILARSNEAEVKNQLRASTKEAKDLGICGVPTYRVCCRKKSGGGGGGGGGGEGGEWKQAGDFVWGQDELAVVEDLITGSDGTGLARVGGDGLRSGQSRL